MFDIKNETAKKLPSSHKRFKQIKEEILGKDYELSLSFIPSAKSKKLNKKYRGRDYAANVLSFPIEKNVGEIFVNLAVHKEAKEFQMSYKKYIEFLIIHGALHLKGFDHGKKMENQEDFFLKKMGW